QNINLLLLGCGDVRNILFSLWLEQAQHCGIQFNFTLCDIEPAVLARNIFLFTFLMRKSIELDSKEHDLLTTLWNSYYHLFITEKDLAILQDHALHLCKASANIDTWTASPYGITVRFMNHYTLSEVRRIWIRYTAQQTPNYDQSVRDRINKTFNARFGDKSFSTLSGIRSVGAHDVASAQVMSAAFRRFWETGVVAGNDHDVGLLLKEDGGQVNPLMAISSAPLGEFAVHYGCEPLLGYRLAEIFDHEQNESDALKSLAHAAKSQFSEWCYAFTEYLSADAVRTMVHCGEAVNFSHQLQDPLGRSTLAKETRVYNKPWHATSIHLLGMGKASPGSTFEIIDTSNLLDHVGILSLFPAVIPLLSSFPCSVLYIESLLRYTEDSSEILESLLHSNVTAASLFFGVAPVGYVLGNTTESFASELFMEELLAQNAETNSQFRMRIPWCRPFEGDPFAKPCSILHANPDEMARYLMGLYLHTFREAEDLSIRMEVIMRRSSKLQASDSDFYNRLTLVALITFMKRLVMTDWERCISSLVDMIEDDRSLILGSNNLQELYLHLHTSGLWNIPDLLSNPRSIVTNFGMARPRTAESGFLRRADLPGIVYVALVVPRYKLGIFTDDVPEKIGTPGLHLSVYHDPLFENSFFAIDVFFGKLRSVPGRDDTCTIEEDVGGWRGRSDLIAVCPIPAWPLLVGPRQALRVALVVNTTIQSTMYFSSKLGGHMRIYDAGLNNEQNLWVLSQQPKLDVECSKDSILLHGLAGREDRAAQTTLLMSNTDPSIPSGPVDSSQRPEDTATTTIVLTDDGAVKAISVLTKFSKVRPEHKALQSGASVVVSQGSPCTIIATIGVHKYRISFPYPVNGSRCTTRVTRKSSWIDIIAPLSSATQPGGYSSNPFPVVQRQNNDFIAWGMGRINVANNPFVSTALGPGWLSMHMGATLSHLERVLQSERKDISSPILQFKKSLGSIFSGFLGSHPKYPLQKITRAILACDGNSDTLILIKALHHDRDTGSVFLDAFVVCLTDSRLGNPMVAAALGSYISEPTMEIGLTAEEEILWKQALPSFVERCRYTWTHGPQCEYKTGGTVPLSVEHAELPICTCGDGMDICDMPAEFKVFAELATRVAIAPISALPYVESMSPLKDAAAKDRAVSVSQAPSLHGFPESRNASVRLDGVCDHCKTNKVGLKRCARCENTKYCNHSCQKAAWKAHKRECRIKRIGTS
ncbi:hypothetical protein D6C98_10702, partial [Aureobasidium pullulans]